MYSSLSIELRWDLHQIKQTTIGGEFICLLSKCVHNCDDARQILKLQLNFNIFFFSFLRVLRLFHICLIMIQRYSKKNEWKTKDAYNTLICYHRNHASSIKYVYITIHWTVFWFAFVFSSDKYEICEKTMQERKWERKKEKLEENI